MTEKINVASLADFNPAHYIKDLEDIRAYIKVVGDEGDVSAFSEALNTVFLAIGANAVAKALGMSVDCVWDVQMQPSDHLGDLEKVLTFLKAETSQKSSANPHAGSNFEDFLREEGIYHEVNASAIRNVIAAIMKQNSNEPKSAQK
jgi:DNA-binding phage protein